jgi:hypothetical protein
MYLFWNIRISISMTKLIEEINSALALARSMPVI